MSLESERERKFRVVALVLATACAVALGTFPKLQATWKQRELSARVERLKLAAFTPDSTQGLVSLRVQRVGPLLNSWETIGGCGAGSSVGGGTIKWIGRSTRGGLFNAQWLTTYTPVPADNNISGGYNLSSTLQLTRDLGDKWNFGVVAPYLYKYYRDYYGVVTSDNHAVDVSNSGFGDVNLLVTRRFGEINATSLTLAVGLPTGTHDAAYRNNTLTQEKQLGLGKLNGTLTLDHTFDEIWGLVVAGAAVGYRGGENDLGNYRSPVGSIYLHGAYFLGPLVPALGLNFSRFWQADRDRTIPQEMSLTLLAGSASVEWSNDFVALLLGASLPVAVPSFDTQPWLVGFGLSASPF